MTPSFNMATWLPMCIRSVADQNIDVEHLVHDGESKDDTTEVVASFPSITFRSEHDEGMYDAINRGLRSATGDFISYLNCDEQLLPGALKKVAHYFEEHPEVDIVCGDAVVVDGDGEFLSYRKGCRPTEAVLYVHTNTVLSCAMFFRRRVIEESQCYFDTSWKALGDIVWVLEALKKGLVFGELRDYTSVFSVTGDNFGRTEVGQNEKRKFYSESPGWAKCLKYLITAQYRLRRLMTGKYSQGPMEYSIYTRESGEERVTRAVTDPTWRFPYTTAGYIAAENERALAAKEAGARKSRY